jgi:DNA-directed RNA polymerase omega subunit
VSKHITSELAAQAVGGRYDLVLIAANRVREMRIQGSEARVTPQATDISTVLLEIEQGQTGREYLGPDSQHRR